MYSETLFHGSNRERGEGILRSKKNPVTRGSMHWLGDGSYFFVEDFYAYKWIIDMFKQRYKNKELNYDTLLSRYLILKSYVETAKLRVFDLTKAEHKILFDLVHKQMKERKKSTNEFAEGVVLNYMFNELNFSKDFDAVRAVFSVNKKKYRDVKMRLGYMPQEQVCIKNPMIVQNIIEYNFQERVKTFEALLKNFYFDGNFNK